MRGDIRLNDLHLPLLVKVFALFKVAHLPLLLDLPEALFLLLVDVAAELLEVRSEVHLMLRRHSRSLPLAYMRLHLRLIPRRRHRRLILVFSCCGIL